MKSTTSTYVAFQYNMEFFNSFATKDETELIKPISTGKWSIRDIIGHIYFWDLFLLEYMVPEMKDNGVLPDFPDHDNYNEKAIQSIKSFTDTNSLIEEFIITRKKLIANMENLDQEVRFTIGNKKRKFTPESFLRMFVQHDIHHMEQIKSLAD
ncbi:DinB family protein [Sutcliffiella horikoshii]|uniref:DinB family protein n=1 Tax=Sutcliffiella horikoshii TaxID=79883 RepID=A0A5D4TB75_9BACI|nr:DinB family protein [Sutcliffiella horikoshii]TYS72980.1 DinB family protein [Sutcliffiella horikoshii]